MKPKAGTRKWSVPLQMELNSDDLAHIDEFYNTFGVGLWTEHSMWKEYIFANEIETDRVSTFNAALTDFEIKIADQEIKREQEWEVAIPDELKDLRNRDEFV